MKLIFFLLLILLSARPITDPSAHSFFIIWNVGQGQWTTLVHFNKCDHFDFGGETFPLKEIQNICGQKEHHLHLSHWDQDHWGGLKRLMRQTSQLCHDPWPILPPEKKRKPWVEQIQPCQHPSKPWYKPTFDIHLKSNDLSQVYVAENQFLIPGDSTISQEKKWAKNLSSIKIRVLVLGHHGSRTSTSDLLLKSLPHLKLAISTARFKRYKHPHIEVIQKLQKNKIPLLRTEDWGNIGFQI